MDCVVAGWSCNHCEEVILYEEVCKGVLRCEVEQVDVDVSLDGDYRGWVSCRDGVGSCVEV